MSVTDGLRLPVGATLGVLGILSALGPGAANADEPAAIAADTADTIVVVVSAASPIVELRSMHLADLYLGRVARFPNGDRARPIDQEPGSATRKAFYERYLDRSQAQIKAHWSKIIFTGRGRPPEDVPDDEEVKRLVAADPSAIGYIEARYVDGSVRALRIVQ